MDDQKKDLGTTTTQLGKAYLTNKDAKEELEKSRQAFFEVITQELEENGPLAEIKQTVLADTRGDACAQIERKYPDWNIIDISEGASKSYVFKLREDPAVKAYKYVNEADGKTYQRQSAAGPVMLDDERLKEVNPTLYDEITELRPVVKPLDDLEPEQLSQLQDFIYQKKSTVRLGAPRKTKKEDL